MHVFRIRGILFNLLTKSPNMHINRPDITGILISPDQIPLADLDFALLNGPTKTIIRQLFIAKAKETLGNVRGTFSGKVMIPQAELTMDYNMFITQGQKEYDKTMETLEKRLERMMPWTHLENQRKMLEQTLELQKGTPLGIFMI